jgi:hypothetical protein
MLIKIAIVGLVAVAGLAGFIATRPSEYRIVRSRVVSGPPDVVHAYVNDFHKWPEWSPWEKKDPDLKREYSGAAEGPGAVYGWAGNKEVGEGRMTITDSRPPQSITICLEFFKPFAGTSTAQFDFTPAGSGTNVTWAMTGERNFMAKTLDFFLNMDKMIGTEFENGLAALETAASRATAKKAALPAPTT